MTTPTTQPRLEELLDAQHYESGIEVCPGCENHCTVKVFHFQNGRSFYSGNNCEKIYSNEAEKKTRGINMFAEKYAMLFRRKGVPPEQARMTIGIPRALGIYENYPFWHTLFTNCGIRVILSAASTDKLYATGIKSIMADNICFPAKLMHGHIMNLLDKKPDRIFYPYVVYEHKEDSGSGNSFNCPIVSGYSDVIKSAIDTEKNYNIPFDAPVITFKDPDLLHASCTEYLHTLGIDRKTARMAIDKAITEQETYVQALTDRALDVWHKAEAENRITILLAGRPYHTDPYIEHKVAESIADMGIDVITEHAAAGANNVFGELQSVSQWAYPNRIFKAAYFVGKQGRNLQMVELTSFGCGPDAFIIDEVSNLLRRRNKNLTLLKIDDVNNIGSLRLRIRSLVESLQVSRNEPSATEKPLRTTPLFGLEDRRRTLLAPYFGEGYSEYIPSLFRIMGYKLENLPMGNQHDAETGLKYANNDICYPATIVVGSIINALQSGKYDRTQTAVIITQTGGQCRATNYMSLIKNALIEAGFNDIPVVSLALSDNLRNQQPGFTPDWLKIARIVAYTMLYADCINKMYYASCVREKQQGQAAALRKRYIGQALPLVERRDCKGLTALLAEAVRDFTKCTDNSKEAPRIGVVGEIYVKYNSFSHKNVLNWLITQGVEVVPPSIYNFFAQSLVNHHINKDKHIQRNSMPLFLNDAIYAWVKRRTRQFDAICTSFPYYMPFSDMFQDERAASHIVNTAANFGEGWLIPAEISNLAEHGVRNIISLQPFGCIANHVISKGIEKRIKELFPKMNLLFLDFDSSTSDANIFNRLHFMVEHARHSR